MDDYCWIHSSFHVRAEFQGNVGCILDTVLAGKDSIASVAADTPDTAFYQWVPFTLVFQASVYDRMIAFINIEIVTLLSPDQDLLRERKDGHG